MPLPAHVLPVRFPTAMMRSDDLPLIDQLAAAIEHAAPQLSVWLREMKEAEEARRLDGLFHPDERPNYPGLSPPEWDNVAVAGALVTLEALARHVNDAVLGELVDRLLQAFAVIAATRLLPELED